MTNQKQDQWQSTQDTAAPEPNPALAPTGVAGLDAILGGGLPAHHLFLIEGQPGTGKTTLALQFLMAGMARGERTLYVTLAETTAELREIAASHGWTLDGIEIMELVPPDEVLKPETHYTVFHPSDVELGQTMRSIYDQVEKLKPSRLIIDSLSEMRLLAQEPLRLRRQILALKQFFLGRQCSVFLLDDVRSQESETQFASVAHGVIFLEQLALEYGAERRRLRVIKLRGQRYRGGFHDFAIRTGGLEVYPRLISSRFSEVSVSDSVSSGNRPLDDLLGGGLDRGSSTLLVGPAGVGKSVLAAQYTLGSALRNERSMVYLFDERMRTYLSRAQGLDMDVDSQIQRGMVKILQIDPAEITPGHFASMVVEAVEREDIKMIVIDSLSGYINSMPEEKLLLIHLHELFSYLTHRGVTAILTLAQHGPFDRGAVAGAEISYIADAIVMLRYFEAAGEVRQAISVLKKRGGSHEHTIREYRLARGGYHVGDPLRGFQGVLTGVPQYIGMSAPLMEEPALPVPDLA
jgi:circadian clock protein KaiC